MNDTYIELERIWKNYFNGEKNFSDDIFRLFVKQGIKFRSDGSTLKQFTISKPINSEDSYVLGIRYLKKNKTPTEDHYLCKKNKPIRFLDKEIKLYPKNSLEKELPEYKNTHKQEIVIDSQIIDSDPGTVIIDNNSITNVNTISNFLK